MLWIVAIVCACGAYYLLHKKVFKPIRGVETDVEGAPIQRGGRRARPSPLEKLRPGGIKYAVYRSLLEGKTAEEIMEDPRFKGFKGDLGRYITYVRKQLQARSK